MIAQYLIMRGYDVCIIDNRPPVFYGHTRARFHLVDLLKDPWETIIPDYLHGKHIVVLNAAMVRIPENGGPPDSALWNDASKDLNPLFALNVINACLSTGAIIDAIFYVSTLSIFDIGFYRDNGLIMPEVALDYCATDGYGVGKRLGELIHELAATCGLLCSTGSIRLSEPRKLSRYKHAQNGEYAYFLWKHDCARGMELILTQEIFRQGYSVFQLDSILNGVVETTNAENLGFRGSIIVR